MRRACRLIAWLTIAICSISSDVSLYGERFKISLCRLYRTDNFSFFVENLDDKSCVSGRFGDGTFGTNLISGNAEVTEKSETQVAFSVSERSFIINDDGRVTIVNENADDRFYVYTVAQRPFPRAILMHPRERQLEYVPFTSEHWKETDESGFEVVETDALREKWCEKWREEYEKTNNAFMKDNYEHRSCNIF